MYLIDKAANRINKIEKMNFSDLGFKEREHLQEWIANEPTALGEELLIIQKEYDGFFETKERLDLLALDKDGNLVIIENKLDDSGKDVTWQALKYVSYCSSLTEEGIRQIYQEYLSKIGEKKSAEEKLSEFFDDVEYDELTLNKTYGQRLVLIAANFRKEVTSTVMWLMNYNIKIQCFKATPYKLDEKLLLNIEQIIPIKDAEDYMISQFAKSKADGADGRIMAQRHKLRLRFWEKHLEYFKSRSNLFNAINPAKDSWLSTGNGISSCSYGFVITKTYARVEVMFSRNEKSENKFIFDKLKESEKDIEAVFGKMLTWERMDNKKSSRVKYQLDGVSLYDENDWSKMIEFMTENMIKLQKAFDKHIQSVKKELVKFIDSENSEGKEE